MGHIVVLDDNMINMIAAGEVIERPASVLKELMENSIDSGATRINVTIEEGGRKLISVSDNGCGMDAEDLARAFEPHATSKIKAGDDLLAISSLGFRGEALASIASVALVKATTRGKDSDSGSSVEIDCGDKAGPQPCSADYGTTIQVRDLFYKLPARRKFLKTANTEMSHITEQFKRIALANPGLDMSLITGGRLLYQLSSNSGPRQRIAELFSKDISQNLVETKADEKGISIRAYLGKAEISKTNNKFQYVFLNGRFIRDKFISHAIKEAYRGYLELNRYPTVFLFLEMPFEDFDVNVHPTKIEVRFFNANLVHSQIMGCIREKLRGSDFDVTAKLGNASPRSENISLAMEDFFKKYRAVQSSQRKINFSPPAGASHSAPREAFKQRSALAESDEKPQVSPSPVQFLQIHESFIIAETPDGFLIIDQHALHERILYEDLARRVKLNNLESQKLLIPESFEINESQSAAAEKHAGLLEKLGIEIVDFGPKTIAIQAFPTLLAKAKPAEFVADLLDILAEKGSSLDPNTLLDEVLNMAACKAAVKAGQYLSPNEIHQLLQDRETIESSSRCPHGRPTSIKFSVSELEKQFKRT